FSLMVPCLAFNQPPRPIMASNMAVQAMCQPKVSAATTVKPKHTSQPVVRTLLMHSFITTATETIRHTIAGFPLLVLYANMDYNYEDAIIVNAKLNDMAVFAHEGFLNGAGLRVGDKLETHHGQKFTISSILPDDEMPKCVCATTEALFTPHFIVASSSVHYRVTPGQLYESWMGMSGVRRRDF
ncbi:hypothetical protein BDK51DRAFT_8433, partial [Blyttiomyces helicus]